MPLNAVVKDINAVDESLRSFYVEKDGVYQLDVVPVDGVALENVTGLTRALGSERHLRSQVEDRLKSYADLDAAAARDALTRVQAFGDLDPAVAREAIATAERLSKFNPETEAEKLAEQKFNNSKTQLTTQFERRESELKTENSTLKSTLERNKKQLEHVLKVNAIKTELSRHNPLDDAAEVLERMISDNVVMREVNGQYVVEVVDQNGAPRIKDYNGTPFAVADFVAELREKKAALFKPDQTQGVNLTPEKRSAKTSSENPWVQGPNWSLTKQMYLLNTDPKAAERLKSEAGAA